MFEHVIKLGRWTVSSMQVQLLMNESEVVAARGLLRNRNRGSGDPRAYRDRRYERARELKGSAHDSLEESRSFRGLGIKHALFRFA
jgi:hypothetical protein